jgi:predicted outer membrane repeat protein
MRESGRGLIGTLTVPFLWAGLTLGIWLPLPAPAKTHTVTTAGDVGDPNDEVLSLREAISAAASDDTIAFGISGQTIALRGPLLLEDSVKLIGPGADDLAISGEGSDQILRIGSDATVDLTGLRFINGRTGILDAAGGGAISNKGKVTIAKCSFESNEAQNQRGGAIHNSGQLDLSECFFSKNAVTARSGGAIYNVGSVTASKCTFSENAVNEEASSLIGGAAIFNGDGGSATITECTFTANRADAGFGRGAVAHEGGTELTIVDSTFSGNVCEGSFANGAAIWIKNTVPVEIRNCGFENNVATEGGGAIFVSGDAKILSCAFTGNRTEDELGDGGAIRNASNSMVVIEDGTFMKNSAAGKGGAVHNGADGSMTLQNCEVTESFAGRGGAIYCEEGGTVSITNCQLISNASTGDSRRRRHLQ